MKLLQNIFLSLTGCLLISVAMSSCNDSKSYADLLRDETKAINNYLADQRVVGDVPADSVFESRRSLAEKIYKESGATAATGEEHEEAIGKIMSDLAKDPAKDAPYYRMDEDGNVYMKVIREGDMENRPKYNDLVYFRFLRYNLAGYDNGVYPTPEGNASSMVSSAESIRFGNYQSVASSTWGEGVQLPLYYLGYGCEVQLVIRSQAGMSSEIAAVTPYMYEIRYYKSNI